MHFPRERPWLLGVLALSLALPGCDAPATATQVLVVVDSDLTVGSELTRVDVGVFDRTGSAEALGTRSFQLQSGAASPLSFTLPLSFAIAPASRKSARDFRLVVTGRGHPDGLPAETDVVEQTVIAAFVPGAALRLGVFLARECYGKLCRDGAAGELTCVSGDCVPVPVLSDLPRADGTPLAGYVPSVVGGTSDAATPRQSEPDAALAPVDGGTSEPDGDSSAPPTDAGADPEPSDAAADAATSVDAGTCEPGFAPGAGGQCVDIDECSTLDTRCDATSFPCEQTAPPGFICRGQLADWEMPARVNGGQSGFNYDTTTSPGTVIDETTGLQWERAPASAPTSYASAAKYCEDSMLAGFSDWRMPALVELFSLLDETRVGDANAFAIDTNAFSLTSTLTLYWSSTPDVAAPANNTLRRVIDFANASSAGTSSASSSLPVRCVRRARPVAPGFPAQRFERATDTTALDRRTGLIWQTTTAGPYAWADAVAYCAAQNAAGMPRPFRLPGYKELRTLVDSASPSNNGVFSDALGNFTGRSYWSGSEYGKGSANAYYVEFLNGYSGVDQKSKLLFARCVRSSVD